MTRERAIFLLLACMTAHSAFAQTAPQRSEELCEVLKQSAAEKGLEFRPWVTYPGSCDLVIDQGSRLAVTYEESRLYVGLGIEPGHIRDGDLWMRLSALDNLAHIALGTKPQAVFDEQIKISKQLPHAKDDVSGKVQRATVAVGKRDGRLFLVASASVKDIDKMKRDQKREASGEIATWRKVLSRSLLAFAAGAKGYGDAYRSYYQNPRQQSQYTSCYTNFLGSTADTHCY